MRIVKDALHDGGILVLVDFKPGDWPTGPSEDKVRPEEVVSILKQAGFKEVHVDNESLQYQYVITAK